MADGFFSQLFGDTPDKQQAMLMAGLGLMQHNMPQGLMAAAQYMAGAGDRDLNRQYKQAQIAETLAQGKERDAKLKAMERQTAMFEGLLSSLDAAPQAANQAVVGQTGNLSPTLANAQLQNDALTKINQSNPLYGIPREAIRADLATNQGKNLGDWMFKRGTPDMQNVNGVWQDKNRVQAGQSVPQISQNGQASQLIVDPAAPGGFRVIAPQGAIETYGGYQQAEQQAKAESDLVKIYNPATQREEYVTRAQAISATRPPAMQSMPQSASPVATQQPTAQPQAQPGVRGNFTGDPSTIMAAIAQIRDPQERSNAMAAFTEQSRRTKGFTEGAGFPAGPDSTEAATAAGAKAAAEGQAKADVQPVAQRKNDIANANYMLHVIDLASKHPGLSTATGLSGSLDPRNYIPGTDATNFKAVKDQLQGQTFLQAYNNLKGGGQITEVEGAKAQNAIARLNTAQSTEAFKSALSDLREVVQNSVQRLQSGASAAGVPSKFAGDNSKSVARTGMLNGRKVIQYTDGTTAYAD